MTSEVPATPATLPWWKSGERFLGAVLGRLTDEDLDRSSLLPGWTRRQVLAHVACNADALVNLLTWASTGVETPMYPSSEARDTAIGHTAALPPDRLRAEVLAATERLTEAVSAMDTRAWEALVRTAQGRTVPASEVLWMRCREVWVHTVDLDAGVGFADMPEMLQAALVDDVFSVWTRRDCLPDIALRADQRTWGTGTLTASGPLPFVTAWATGRGDGAGLTADGPLPDLPAWV